MTELRQQIRTLNDKVAIVEHENAFLRQQVSSDVLAQYIPLYVGLNPNMSNESNNTTTATATITSVPNLSSSSVASSQTLPMVSQSSIPSSMPVPTTTGTSSNTAAAAPPQSVNLPPINWYQTAFINVLSSFFFSRFFLSITYLFFRSFVCACACVFVRISYSLSVHIALMGDSKAAAAAGEKEDEEGEKIEVKQNPSELRSCVYS